MNTLKIVTAKEMARIEDLAIQKGCNEEEFVLRAGHCVANAVEEYIQQHHRAKDVVILAGKGNKGADAFAAGLELLSKGFLVRAYHLASLDECRPFCKKFAEFFQKRGGEYIEIRNQTDLIFGVDQLIIDGLLGTGCAGPVTGLYRSVIERANDSGLPILAVDIPSGLNGSTGVVEGAAIQAHMTIAMGLPKIGFFLRDGWNYVGAMRIGDFGLPPEYIGSAREAATLPWWREMFPLLPKLKRNRHKYQAGCVVGFAGSASFSGAAKLASLAALRGGAGIVKLFFPPEAEGHMMDAPYEVICMPWTESSWNDALLKANSVFIGPGIGRSEEMKRWLEKNVSKLNLPAVLDADALFSGLPFPSSSICTPHRGEMIRLLGKETMDEAALLEECQRFSDEKKTVLVLKGAPTWIFSPQSKPSIISRGDPGMATAGSGDVLTGLLASLLAQGCEPLHAAIVGVTIHALSGEMAAQEKTSYCMIAGDLIAHFPDAYKKIMVHPTNAYLSMKCVD